MKSVESSAIKSANVPKLMYFVNIVNWLPIACRLSTAFFGQCAPYCQPSGGYAIYIGNTYILTSFTNMSFQTTGSSLKSSSCHTVLDSPTFLYVIILCITIEIMYYYKLYLLYTNNVPKCRRAFDKSGRRVISAKSRS